MICSINMLHSVSLTVLLFQSMLGSIVRAPFCLIAWSVSEYHSDLICLKGKKRSLCNRVTKYMGVWTVVGLF